MDGKELLYQLRQLLNEASDSGYLDTKTSYHYLNEAAHEVIRRTRFLKASQTITTVAEQSAYDLSADFMQLYLRNDENEEFVTINDGSTNHFAYWKDYDDIVYSDNTTSVTLPGFFTILNNATLATRISSTTTSAGAASGGECTLTDTAADFTDVSAGDIVHNTTDGSDGIVLSKTSSTVLVAALFGGTNNDWTSGDSYIIQPQGRLQVVFDPPFSTAGYTITVRYIQRPAPVYSDYGIFKIPSQYMNALVKYAVWLYKYRDSEPNFGDSFYLYFDRQVRAIADTINHSLNRKGVKVNFRARKRGRYGRR
jgi:hypothetical protein